MKDSKATKIVSAAVFGSMVLSVIYIIIRIIMVPGGSAAQNERSESDYILMLLQCIMGILIMFVPGLISRKFSVEIPNWMYLVFVLFLFCSIYLGEVQSFYYQFKHWDAFLHAVSGGMLGSLGFSFVTLLNKSERVPVNLSPIFVVLFAFCFAVMLGVLWEIYEFTLDGLLGLNMQKFAQSDGTLLTGRAALANTMKDLILDCTGAFVMSVIGYISLKYKKGWVESMLIKKTKNSTGIETEQSAN